VFYIRENYYVLIAFVVMMLISVTATAMEIKPNARLDMQYTDNAKKVAENEKKDLIVTTSVGTGIKEDTGPIQLDINGSIKYLDYTQDTFDNQTYFNLDATANWEMLKDRLGWKVQDFYTQQSINSLDPDTPDNTADSNVFTFGPNINYAISGRQSLTIKPEFRRYDYEHQLIDNQQNSLDVSWKYHLFRTVEVGMRGGVNKVYYDDQQFTDNDFRSVHFTLAGTRPSYDLSAEIGLTQVKKKDVTYARGLTGNMSWLFNITGYSSMRTYIATDLTDANNSLLNASINPDEIDFSNDQISAEILRNSIVRLAYQRNNVTLNSRVWIELRKQNSVYPVGRDVQTVGLEFNHPLTATLSSGVNARYSSIELIDGDRKDAEYSIGGSLNYRFSRKILGAVNVKYYDKDSSIDTEDFDEMIVLVSVIYGYGG